MTLVGGRAVSLALCLIVLASALAQGQPLSRASGQLATSYYPVVDGTGLPTITEATASLTSVEGPLASQASNERAGAGSGDGFGLTNWTHVSPPTSPGPRQDVSMVYDAADGYVLLFGGWGPGGTFGYGFLNQTWKFQNGTWTQLHPAVSPSPRDFAAMAYDAADGYVVLFGGCGVVYASNASCPPALNDTWTYRGGVWTNITPAASPSARYLAGMTYDAADGYVLLFGGLTSSGHALGDTWEFRGGIWSRLSPSASPSARDGFAMSFDGADGYVLLFGGSAFPDTWVFKAGDWFNISTTVSPSPQFLDFADYDAAAGFVLLYAGLTMSGNLANDTWAFRGGTWTNITPDISPPWRLSEGLTFDPATGAVVLFGGESPTGPPLNDTWEYISSASPAIPDSVTFAIDPSICGPILWNGEQYANGSSATQVGGDYLAQAQACKGYSFVGWYGTAGVTPLDPTDADSTVEIGGSGNLSASFELLYTLLIEVEPTGCGPVDLGGTDVSQGAIINLTIGQYAVMAPSCQGMSFSTWAAGGGVSVLSPGSADTSILVTRSGTLSARYASSRTTGAMFSLQTLILVGIGGGALVAVAWVVDRRRGRLGPPTTAPTAAVATERR